MLSLDFFELWFSNLKLPRDDIHWVPPPPTRPTAISNLSLVFMSLNVCFNLHAVVYLYVIPSVLHFNAENLN